MAANSVSESTEIAPAPGLKLFCKMPHKRTPTVFCFLPLLAVSALAGQPWREHGALGVSPKNPHYLAHEDGTPFWWFGDTAWELIHRANREEVALYLEDRRAKGFNVIQTVVLSETLRTKGTNYYGVAPFVDDDPLIPMPVPENGYGFFEHVEYVVAEAARRGLYVGLLPTWGEWVVPRNGAPLFDTVEQAYGYGWFLGDRLSEARNVIWILGGDRQPDERPEGVALWRAMAEGIADGVNGERGQDGVADYTTTLMTHHCYNSSSNWFHADPWIDLHTWGSYHSEYNDTRSWELAEADWALPHPKPTLNSEPCYEGLPLNYAVPDNGYFQAVDVRIAAYWSVFSGAAGFTYGANPIWQFTDAKRPPHMHTVGTWHEALSFPGARHVRHLRTLLESRPSDHLRPARELIVAGGGQPAQRTVVLRGDHHVLAYIPTGADLTLRLGSLPGERVRAWWFDPRSGEASLIGEFDDLGEHTFQVPGMSEDLAWLRSGRGCDWVLVLDDPSHFTGAPGRGE